jgi:NADP-dependent 3-hydroxy acid dehydrogenase YdfG
VNNVPHQIALITGIGSPLSEHLADKLLANNYQVIGLSRHPPILKESIHQHSRFHNYCCDIGDSLSINTVLDTIRYDHGDPTLFIHNAAQLLLKDFLSITPDDFENIWRTSCLGAANVAQQLLPAMIASKSGVMIFTGATASIKAGPQSAAFAAAKFGLRGLAQSLARAYQPQGVHIVHTVIDGVIWGQRAKEQFKMSKENCMSAEDIADTYLSLAQQAPSCWTHEIELRPYTEKF